jgi:hypothetical protein
MARQKHFEGQADVWPFSIWANSPTAISEASGEA